MERNNKGLTLIEIGVVLTVVAILACAVAPRFFDLRANADEACAHKLLNSLKTATMFYVADEKKTPDCFNDFVAISGKPSDSQTLSLDSIRSQTKSITMTANTKQIEVEFLRGTRAVYYLSGNDVVADITN